jgi:hypothetical protein
MRLNLEDWRWMVAGFRNKKKFNKLKGCAQKP